MLSDAGSFLLHCTETEADIQFLTQKSCCSRNLARNTKPCCSHFAPDLPNLWICSSDAKAGPMWPCTPGAAAALSPAELCPWGRGTEGRGSSPSQLCHLWPLPAPSQRGMRQEATSRHWEEGRFPSSPAHGSALEKLLMFKISACVRPHQSHRQ